MISKQDTHSTPPGDGPIRSAQKLVEQFDEQVAKNPNAVGAYYQGRDVTYAQLAQWSDAYASQLLAASDGDLVGIATPRGPLSMAAVLACIKAGVGHVAVDPSLPIRRQRQLLKHARPSALLLDKSLDRFTTLDVPRVWLHPLEETPPRCVLPDWPERRSSEVFHIVYTSGTTGVPKGVCVSFDSVLNRLQWMWQDYPFSDDAVMAVHKSISLVASPWEILGGLLGGSRSVFLTREDLLDPALFAAVIERKHLTHLLLTPHLISGLLDEVERRGGLQHRLQLVTSGADSLPAQLARRFHQHLPGVTLLNLYGMTETASNVAAYDTSQLSPTAAQVPVGRPVAGANISVRDRHLRLLPPGVSGEICISGAPLALGYLRDPEQTAERFVTLADGTVMYRTGDLGRWLASKDLEVTGRADNQIKVRGYRVELEEIEQTILASPYVDEAGVCVSDDPEEATILAGVCAAGDVDLGALRAYLRDRLPTFMMPSRIVVIDALPRGTNGKLARATLLRSIMHHITTPTKQTWSPGDPNQAQIAAIWTELLGAPPEDAEQDFFDAGGHSLLVVRLSSRIEAVFDKKIPLRVIFDAPTVAGLAAAVA